MSTGTQIPRPVKLAQRLGDKGDGQDSLQTQMQLDDDHFHYFCRVVQEQAHKHLVVGKRYCEQDLASQRRFHAECERSMAALDFNRYGGQWPIRAYVVPFLTKYRANSSHRKAPPVSSAELSRRTHSPTRKDRQPEGSNSLSESRVLRSAIRQVVSSNTCVASSSLSRAPVYPERSAVEPLPSPSSPPPPPSQGVAASDAGSNEATLTFLKSLRPSQEPLLPVLIEAGFNSDDSLLMMMFNAPSRESFFNALALQRKITLFQATLLKEGLAAMR